MEKDDVYTVIVKKFPLGKDSFGSDIYIYKPLEIQQGFISDDIFYNDNAREYHSIEDIMVKNKEFDEGYFLDLTKEELLEQYNIETEKEIYDFYNDLIENSFVLGYVDMDGMLTISTMNKDKLLEEDMFTIAYTGGDIVIPLENVKEVLSTGDMEQINQFVEALDVYKENIENMIIDQAHEEEEEQKEDLLSEEDKKEIAEELLKQQQMKEIEEAFAKEEAVTNISKEKIRELYKDLMSKVIGQEEAIETACYVIYKNARLKDGESKTNCIFVGPTGSGKSMIADTIGAFLKEKPLVHVDANSLSTTGYVGDNVEDCLSQLMVKADGNKFIAEHGIVVFDEVDKKGTKDNGDVGGKGVINQLLRFVEGQQYKVEYVLNNKKRQVIFDTTNLTVFACGAFPEVYDELINSKTEKPTMGFNGVVKTKEEIEKEKKDKINSIDISHEDLATKGKMGPEFTGRFIIAPLHRLTKDTLKDIITTSKASPLTREIKLLEEDDIVFYNDDKFVESIASKAYDEGTGGRGVKNSIEKVFKKIVKKTVLTMDDQYADEETGKTYLYGTADDEGNIIVKTKDGNNILEDEVKEKSKGKVLKL